MNECKSVCLSVAEWENDCGWAFEKALEGLLVAGVRNIALGQRPSLPEATSSRQLGQKVLCFTTPWTQGWARTRSYHLPLGTPLAVLLLQETLTVWWWLKKKRFQLHRLSAQLRMTARKWSKPPFPGVLGTLLRYHLFYCLCLPAVILVDVIFI